MRIHQMCAVAVVCLSAPADGQSVDAAIDRAVAAHATIRTARGTFEMTVTTPATGSTYTSRGSFQQRMPSGMALLFSDPKDDRLISDGKVLWMDFPSIYPGTVIKTSLGPSRGSLTPGSLDLVGRFLDSPKTRYDRTIAGTAVVGGRATTIVHLIPRQPMPEFETATVWIDDANGLIRQFEVQHSKAMGSQIRRMRFVTFQPNAAVDASVFRFVVPKGKKVEDRTKG